MSRAMDDVCLARLSRAALAGLAALRCHRGVTVFGQGDTLWLRWQAGDEAVLSQVLPLDGVELFLRRDDRWYRFGHRLPAFDMGPLGDGQPLERVLFPAPVAPEPPLDRPLTPVTLTLLRDDHPRPTTGLTCKLQTLNAWADRATTAELEVAQAARSGDRVLVLGRSLPLLLEGQRLWGHGVLAPLGWRPEPGLTEDALRSALGVESDEFVLLDHAGVEVVPRDAFQPLSRAGVRLALAERP
jgi:hypothetical protein